MNINHHQSLVKLTVQNVWLFLYLSICSDLSRCCHNERLGCPEDIFDCHAGLKDWRHGWSEVRWSMKGSTDDDDDDDDDDAGGGGGGGGGEHFLLKTVDVWSWPLVDWQFRLQDLFCRQRRSGAVKLSIVAASEVCRAGTGNSFSWCWEILRETKISNFFDSNCSVFVFTFLESELSTGFYQLVYTDE